MVQPQIILKVHHILGSLSAIADKLSHDKQLIEQMASAYKTFQSDLELVALSPDGHVYHKVQERAALVFINGSGSEGLGSGCAQPVMGLSGHLYLSSCAPSGKSDQVGPTGPTRTTCCLNHSTGVFTGTFQT